MLYSSDYRNQKWRHLRELILRRDGYKCQLSKRYGKTVQAEVVHHIFPKNEFPEYKWEAWNLISLSAEMHNKLHDRSNDELTEEGVRLLQRTARRAGIAVPEKYK